MTDSREITIIGAGPAGCTLALLLAQSGWSTTLYEAGPWAVASTSSPRTLALTRSSWATLSRTGLPVTTMPRSLIDFIHVSQQGLPGQVILRAKDEGEDAFGWTIGYDDLVRALRHEVDREPRITVKSEQAITEVVPAKIGAKISFTGPEGREEYRLAPLVVIAEGGRALEDQQMLSWSYGASALSCQIKTKGNPAGVAWERFTPRGPMALLPAREGLALIWTGPNLFLEGLLKLDDEPFLEELRKSFGERAGQFIEVSPRIRYPLRTAFSLGAVSPRVVRIANAAQTLHPVAGQGFNLGLRDVLALTRVLGAYAGQDPGAAEPLNEYQKLRQKDRWVTGGLTHVLASGLALPIPGVRQGASLLFMLMDLSPTLKRQFSQLMSDGVSP